ncbi:MAG: SRPBCC domain-containing protein [Anaerolineales bacterium]|nr:SRPBCC domain-containing protein [Anaerolineales bacterium]
MDSVTASIQIKAGKDKVFDAFVNRVNDWWPFKGKFTYSFAPEETAPGQIHFEARLGGRFYEVFANGEEFQIGEVSAWQPPERFSFTWKGEEYQAPTQVLVEFTEADGQTTVTLTHSGWAAAGVPQYAASYGDGWEEILGVFGEWVLAP